MNLDVGAPASHVGSHGDPTRLPGAGHDFGLLAVLSRIEDDRLQPCLEQQLADVFRSVDRTCPDQNGPALSRYCVDGVYYRIPFRRRRTKDLIPKFVLRNGRFVGMRTTRNP
jgi:hypothetical protein